ncbi:hypothetical protein MGA3_03575 [Bacillus methanolicus MGA3]|nr:hypothetical protein MGA3_03575 [Bacillus methanolicus MGA3]
MLQKTFFSDIKRGKKAVSVELLLKEQGMGFFGYTKSHPAVVAEELLPRRLFYFCRG